jgi:hypothetical protein
MRILKKIVLGVLGGILGIYLLFAIGLMILEWIVRENPLRSTRITSSSTATPTTIGWTSPRTDVGLTPGVG